MWVYGSKNSAYTPHMAANPDDIPKFERDPALQAIVDAPELALAGLDLQMSPELTRLLERGLIGNSLPPILKDSRAAKAFQQAFEMIGGVPRLALWADQNPTKFYTLYSKLVPATAEILEKRDIHVHISWASPDRLSYQNQGPVTDVDPD